MTDRPVNGAPAGPFLDDDFELLQLDRELKDARFETQPIGFFKDAAIRLCHNGAALAALVLILIVIFMAAFGPGMNKYGYNDQYIDYVNMPPKIPFLAQFGMADGSRVLQNRRLDNVNNPEKMPQDAILEIFNEREVRGVTMVDVKVDYYLYTGCEETFWFGTDYLGRDLWTRLWRGTRISLFIAIISVLTNVVIGVVYGSVAGYYGGKVDMVMMRICEIIQSFPRVVIATLFIMVFGTGLFSIIMSLLISGWISTARMIRSQFYRFKDREYVLAARTMGISDRSIIFRYDRRAQRHLHRVLPGLHRPGAAGAGAQHRRAAVRGPEGAAELSLPVPVPRHRHFRADDLLQPLRQRPARRHGSHPAGHLSEGGVRA